MKKVILISSLLVVALGAGYVFAPKDMFEKKQAPVKEVKKQEKVVLTVSTIKPFMEKLPQNISVTGPVVAWQEAIIGSEIPGVSIQALYVDVGDIVKEGQLLAKLNSSAVWAGVNQAKASLQESRANYEEAKANADIARSVEKRNALSAQKVKQYITAELTAKARVEAANAALQSQNVRLNQTSVLAPADGIISYRNASVGNIVGQSEMFRIIIEEKLQWKAQVSSDKILQVQKGMPVEIKTKEPIKAQVTEISPNVDSQTRQGTVYVNLTKDQHLNKIKAGMFVEGKINLETKEQMLIPQQAIVLRDGFNYVFVLNGNKVKQVKVSLGDRHGNNVQVSGVQLEDNIVETGATFLKDGDTVKVVESK